MSVLAMPLSLGIRFPNPIEDVEALVRKVLGDRLRGFGVRDGRLNYHDEEDAIAYLIGVAYECERRYDPGKERNPDRANFAAYASKILSFRVVDWYRQRFDDTRHGEKPIVLSLDAPASLGPHAEAEGADRLVDTLAASTGDPAEDRAPDLVRVLHGGAGGGARSHAQVGQQAAGGASGRTGSAAGPASGRARLKPAVPPTRRAPSRPPICSACFPVFRGAFDKVNKHVAAADRLTAGQLDAKAAKRAQAVRFGKEWACPRCTKLENEEGQELMLRDAYPNRAARRTAAKQVGLAANRKKGPNKQAQRRAADQAVRRQKRAGIAPAA